MPSPDMADQSIGTVLEHLQRLLLTENPSTGTTTELDPTVPLVPLEELTRLPATATLQEMATELEQAVAEERTDKPLDSTKQRQLHRALIRAAARLEWGMYRDSLQVARPEGCWCLGVGGREEQGIPPFAEHPEPTLMWRTYCDCPEGQALKLGHDFVRAAFRAHMINLKLRNAFQDAQLPLEFQHCSFESYPVSPSTAPAVTQIRAWAEDAASERWLLLHGPFGTGKTGLAASAFRVRLLLVPGGLFITTPDLLAKIRATYKDGGDEDALIKRVKEVPLLVLDDIGAEKITDWVLETFFRIINTRHNERRATILTSNLTPKQLDQHLGDRLMWRIVQRADVIAIKGPNLRDPRRQAS